MCAVQENLFIGKSIMNYLLSVDETKKKKCTFASCCADRIAAFHPASLRGKKTPRVSYSHDETLLM